MRRSLRDPAWLAAVTAQRWSPLALSPALWLDASDASTITDAGAGAVSQWRDKSGNARHVNQTTPANRPTTGTRTQNGRNVIDFGPRGRFLDGGDILDLGIGAFSSFSVVKFDDTSDSTPFGKHVFGATDGRYGLAKVSGALQSIYDEGPAAGAVSVPDTATTCRQISTILTRAGASSSHVLRLDGVQTTKAFTDIATTWNTTAPWRLGRYGTSTALDFDGFVAEIIVIMRTATASEIAAVEAYLKAKWGTA